MTWSTDPSKNVSKNQQQKTHDNAVQSKILWLNLNKIDMISVLQSADEQENLSFHIHVPRSKCRYPCTQTASAVLK